jgi:predicted DNA binding CopG/RHH family protein
MPKEQKPPVPSIPSAKQEAEFWENHSALDYNLNFSSEPLDVHPDARSISINLRLPRWLIDQIKAIAQEDGITYQRLIRQVLIAFVESRRKRATPTE